MSWLSALPVIGSVVDSFIGSKDAKNATQSNERINAQNIALQRETNAQNLFLSNRSRRDSLAENNRQYDLARNTIKYKTEDAKNSGIHPLYALGANTLSSAVSLAGQIPMSSPQAQQTYSRKPSTNFGESIAQSIATQYDNQVKAKNLQLMDSEIRLKNAQTLDVISQAKQASSLARSVQTGRTFGDPTHLRLSAKRDGQWHGDPVRKKGLQDIDSIYGNDASGLLGLTYMLTDMFSDAAESAYLHSSNWFKKNIQYKGKGSPNKPLIY